MKVKPRSIHSINQLVEDQFSKWQITGKEKGKDELPVITISREPGSKGTLIAKQLVKQLNLDLFGSSIIHEVAKDANMSQRVVGTLDEKRRSWLDEVVETMESKRHLWDYQYLNHLTKIIATIGNHGRAVILGRGANFILSPDKTLMVRVIAPQKTRIKNIARERGVSEEEATKHVIDMESGRRAFARKYFHADITDPIHYDLVINTANLSVDAAVEAVKAALKLKMSA